MIHGDTQSCTRIEREFCINQDKSEKKNLGDDVSSGRHPHISGGGYGGKAEKGVERESDSKSNSSLFRADLPNESPLLPTKLGAFLHEEPFEHTKAIMRDLVLTIVAKDVKEMESIFAALKNIGSLLVFIVSSNRRLHHLFSISLLYLCFLSSLVFCNTYSGGVQLCKSSLLSGLAKEGLD